MKYLLITFLLLSEVGKAQNSLSLKPHLGYSSPAFLKKSYSFSAYEVEGRFSQSFYATYSRTMQKHKVKFQSGFNFLGFKSRHFVGLTPNDEFRDAKDNLPILSKIVYKLVYFDNSLGYGYSINSKNSFSANFHYFYNVLSTTTTYATVADSDPNARLSLRNTYDTDLKKRNLSFYNHFAISTEYEHTVSKKLNIGVSWLIGLSEFNPFLLSTRHNNRLNQNFSVFASYNLIDF